MKLLQHILVLSSNGRWTRLKPLFLIPLFIFSFLHADMITHKTLACPTVDALQKAPVETTSNSLELEMYTIANSCVILSREDKIEAIGYDPRNSKEIYQQIVYKRTGTQLYMLRSAILVEQGGKKNSYRF